uniref:F-box domain-containing protein n=1 Tax=Strongyloides venezuelensis TaxID=75913 RepID=A0A0K0EWH9_STRVS
MKMDNIDEKDILFELFNINLVRKTIINHIPSFSDINNLVDVCKFMNRDFEKEKIERNIFSYGDCQNIRITCGDEYDEDSDVPGLSNIEFREDILSEDLLNISRTFFGETLHDGNCVSYFIDPSIKEWKEEDHVAFVKKLVEELNLKCKTRKDINTLEFQFGFRNNVGYIIIDALSYMEHDNITRISFPVDCFTCPSNKYNMINGNIFRGFPNLSDLSLTCPLPQCNYYDLTQHRDIFERFVQQFATIKNPTIFFKSLKHNDAMFVNNLNEIINIITRYNVKVKLGINIDCPRFGEQCQNCTDTMGFFSPIKEYITTAYSTVRYHKHLLHSIRILETFKNLSELHLRFTLDDINFNFLASDGQKPGDLGLKELNSLKNVKLEYSRNLNDHDSDVLNLFYQFFEFTCSMMPRNVEILQLEHVPDMDDATARMITKYMPNIKLLKIQCLSYKESDGLDNFAQLECLISYDYCPITVPKTLKILAFEHKKYAVRRDDLIFTDSVIKSHFEEFTKRISDNKNRFILFKDICEWKLYKYVIQKYFYL